MECGPDTPCEPLSGFCSGLATADVCDPQMGLDVSSANSWIFCGLSVPVGSCLPVPSHCPSVSVFPFLSLSLGGVHPLKSPDELTAA